MLSFTKAPCGVHNLKLGNHKIKSNLKHQNREENWKFEFV